MLRNVVTLLLLAICLPVQADQEKVYLLGGFNYRGTPITMAVVLYDRQVTNLQQCRDYIDKRVRGKPYEVEYYRHFVGPQRQGVNMFKRYTCFKSTMAVQSWNERDFYSHVYLIDLRNGQYFASFDSLNSCWASIRKEPLKHSSKLFCAKFNQRLGNR